MKLLEPWLVNKKLPKETKDYYYSFIITIIATQQIQADLISQNTLCQGKCYTGDIGNTWDRSWDSKSGRNGCGFLKNRLPGLLVDP
jgi:hypothetical protein